MSSVAITDEFVNAVRAMHTLADLASLLDAVAREMRFRHFALVHHSDLRKKAPGDVDLKDYPAAVVERLIGECRYRRDPVIRSCLFADSAFLWSDLGRIITLDRQDRTNLEFGLKEGLDEGITVPCLRLGERMGSCTFAGMRGGCVPHRYLGSVQVIGVFAFQAARRLVSPTPTLAPVPRLNPRPRDCVVLAGRGYSNKEIARALSLAPRTVDGYLTGARRKFGAHDRTELVVSAALAGEIELAELRRR